MLRAFLPFVFTRAQACTTHACLRMPPSSLFDATKVINLTLSPHWVLCSMQCVAWTSHSQSVFAPLHPTQTQTNTPEHPSHRDAVYEMVSCSICVSSKYHTRVVMCDFVSLSPWLYTCVCARVNVCVERKSIYLVPVSQRKFVPGQPINACTNRPSLSLSADDEENKNSKVKN